jgi:asparagine synthase (glutamine-hydrolysing)
VDLSEAGHQPMGNEDGTLAMVFNGEIYNAPELRLYCQSRGHRFRSGMDGEVILHLWEMEGPESLARLNGIFAVAIASTVTGEVFLARDPLGVKPLFYASDVDDSLWFASEPAALDSMGVPSLGHDVVALAQFLTFLWVPSPRSPRRGVHSLPAGHVLRWTVDGITDRRYGAPLLPTVNPDTQPTAVIVAHAKEQLLQASERQLMADVPVGLMASGGVDSGLLWWAGRKHLDRAYTIQWSVPDDRERLDDDRRAVEDLQRLFGTAVDYIDGENAADTIPSSGDLFADPAFNLTRLIAQYAQQHGQTVLWSGQGGDELFGGYRRHAIAPLLPIAQTRGLGYTLQRLARLIPTRGLRSEYASRLALALAEPDPFRGYMQLCSYSTASERARALDCTEAEVSDDIVWQEHQGVYDALPHGLSLLRRCMTVDLAVYLPGLGLAYADRAGMEFGVEVRVPWLDLELVRWSLQLPDAALRRRGRGKLIPRTLAAEVVGPTFANRPKRAFAAPAARVESERESDHGERGFRQGAYFTRARRILDTYLMRP